MMKGQKVLALLTALNLGILMYQLVRPQVGMAATVFDLPVLRGRALEIVDDRGRVRASLSIIPEDPKVQWKGAPYPEAVLLRLITPDGRPNVKLGASKMGGALAIGGETNGTYAQVLAEGGETSVKLVNRGGVERVIHP
jgi:hypothetical protein